MKGRSFYDTPFVSVSQLKIKKLLNNINFLIGLFRLTVSVG